MNWSCYISLIIKYRLAKKLHYEIWKHLQSKARSLCALASTPKTIFLSVAPLSAIACLCSTKLRELEHTYTRRFKKEMMWSLELKWDKGDGGQPIQWMLLFLWESCVGLAETCDMSRETREWKNSRERRGPRLTLIQSFISSFICLQSVTIKCFYTGVWQNVIFFVK